MLPMVERSEIDIPGIPGNHNRWFPGQGQARKAALQAARRLGLGTRIAHHARPRVGLPHYHLAYPDGRPLERTHPAYSHFFYGRRPPRRMFRGRPWREFESAVPGAVDPLKVRAPVAADPRAPIKMPALFICAGDPVRLDRFPFGRATLRRDSVQNHLAQVRDIASRIVASQRTTRPINLVCIDGHTDNRGPEGLNERLGRQRALSVYRHLVAELDRRSPGLSRRIRIVPQTFGELSPAFSNRTVEGRARNRRVDVFLSSDPTAAGPPRPSGMRTCVADCIREARMRLGRPLTSLEQWRLRRRCQRDCAGRPV